MVHAKKFQLVNWVPTKLDIPINLPPSDTLILDKYIGKGLQDTEVELPGDKPGKDTILSCQRFSAQPVRGPKRISRIADIQCRGNGSARRDGLPDSSVPESATCYWERRPKRCHGVAVCSYGRPWYESPRACGTFKLLTDAQASMTRSLSAGAVLRAPNHLQNRSLC